MYDSGVIENGAREREIERRGDVVGAHGGAEFPSHEIAREIIEDGGYLMPRRPHPRSCFFKQTIFEREVGDDFLDLARCGGAGGVAGQAPFARFQKLLRPAVILR